MHSPTLPLTTGGLFFDSGNDKQIALLRTSTVNLFDTMNIQYNMRPKTLEAFGFVKYFDEPPTTKHVKDKIRPPKGTEFIFIGCGKQGKEKVQQSTF